MPKIYMLSFDPSQTNAVALHNLVTTIPSLGGWWHYLGPVYLFTTTASALEIQNYINSKWSGRFLVAEIDGHNTGGWLPKDAWDWINSRR